MNNISICIITKNERDNLITCLERIANLDMEIVVIDTGSSDDSKEIALRYTNHVYDFVWCDDFSAARNFAISKATRDYILMVDTDEFIDEIDIAELNKLIQDNPTGIGLLLRKNLFENNATEMTSTIRISRLFPKALYHYEGRIHEQVVPINPLELPNPSHYDIPIFMTHVGYTGDSTAKQIKANRNLSLLLIELEQNPNDPYILYQIGKAYYYMQDYRNALIYFGKALEQPVDIKIQYVHSLITMYGYCFINTKQYADGLMLTAVYDELQDDADYLFVIGLIYMYNAQFDMAIAQFQKATTISKCTVEGVNSYSALYNIGVIYECLGNTTDALVYYKKCGDYTPALQRIKEIQ